MKTYHVRFLRNLCTNVSFEAETEEELKILIDNFINESVPTATVTSEVDGMATISSPVVKERPNLNWAPWGAAKMDNIYEEGSNDFAARDKLSDEIKEYVEKQTKIRMGLMFRRSRNG
jgi:hypothetical protein